MNHKNLIIIAFVTIIILVAVLGFATGTPYVKVSSVMKYHIQTSNSAITVDISENNYAHLLVASSATNEEITRLDYILPAQFKENLNLLVENVLSTCDKKQTRESEILLNANGQSCGWSQANLRQGGSPQSLWRFMESNFLVSLRTTYFFERRATIENENGESEKEALAWKNATNELKKWWISELPIITNIGLIDAEAENYFSSRQFTKAADKFKEVYNSNVSFYLLEYSHPLVSQPII
ncbi:MAG: hypothetical protein AAB415_00625 [Patescibacteria group bacterium]